MKIYRFRNCYLNQAERRVLRDGTYLELTTKTFDVLQLLIENRGAVLTKDDILGSVWNGSYVEEGNLAVHISKLRRLLDETKNQPYIETVQGCGYRFVAPVQEASQSDWEKHSSQIELPAQDNAPREWIFDSIAVLPLLNENGDAEIEYLADGLTESFINSLSRLQNLKVIARNTVFRYKNKNADAKEVGETLGVATVLTGRIRIIKDVLTISIELTKTEDGTQLWGDHFNRSFTDIFEVQESIIYEIVEKLKSEINNSSKHQVTNQITKSPESYRLYLKGKYLQEKWTKNNLYKAIDYFQQSIFFDPLNIHSYVEIIETYFSLYFSDHLSYLNVVDQTLPLLSVISELNQSLDVVQAMYGGKKMYLDWNFKEGEKHLLNSIEINPNCLIARHRYSDFLLLSGKFTESLRELQLIMLIDPFSFPTYKRIGRLFYKMGHFESAITYLNDALEIEPTDYITLAILGATLTELGNYKKALSIFQKSLNSYYNTEIESMIGYIYAIEGKLDEANKIINHIKAQPQDSCQQEIKLARIYLALGEKDVAYDYLEKAYEHHNVDIVSLNSDPRWKIIRHESRFKSLILRLGLYAD
ncbi:MAG TPA: winged helix-turn-helix domain-containing protein [Pyrinomonadaceae bacterium]|jgi:TolB-like protein/Flp pilus assembly protein TadD